MEASLASNFLLSVGLLVTLITIYLLLARQTSRARRSLGTEAPLSFLDRTARDGVGEVEEHTPKPAATVTFLAGILLLLLFLVWWAATRLLHWPALFLVVLGAASAVPMCEIVLETRTATFWSLLNKRNHSGHLQLARSLNHRIGMYQYFSFAGLFAVVASISPSWFLVGCIIECLFVSVQKRAKAIDAKDAEYRLGMPQSG